MGMLNSGLNIFASSMIGSQIPSRIAIGIGSETFNATGLSLETETDRNLVSDNDSSEGTQITLIANFAAGEISGTSLREYGTTSIGSTFLNREVLAGSEVFDGEQELQIQQTFKIYNLVGTVLNGLTVIANNLIGSVLPTHVVLGNGSDAFNVNQSGLQNEVTRDTFDSSDTTTPEEITFSKTYNPVDTSGLVVVEAGMITTGSVLVNRCVTAGSFVLDHEHILTANQTFKFFN